MKVYEIEAKWSIYDGLYDGYDNYQDHCVEEALCYGMYASKELAQKVLAGIDLNTVAKKDLELEHIEHEISQCDCDSYLDILTQLAETWKTIHITVNLDKIWLDFESFDITFRIIEHEVEEGENGST